MLDSLYLGAYWRNRRMTLREYAAVTQRFLARLRELHPLFQELVSWGDTEDSAVALLPDLANLEGLILTRNHGRDAIYSHPGPDGGPSLDSECRRGFIMNYSTHRAAVQENVQVMITAGVYSPALTNALVIDFPRAGSQEFQQYEFSRALLGVVVECWQPRMALITSPSFRDKLGGEGGPRTIGWMTWFADVAVKEALPSGTDAEPMRGGVLVTTARDVMSTGLSEHLSTAQRIQDRLKAHGVLG